MRSSTLLPPILLAGWLMACNKGGNEEVPVSNERRFIYVSEFGTNIPLAGARVKLQRCSRSDFEFGCQGYSTVTILTTDSSGKAFYSPEIDWDDAEASKENYWTRSGSSSITLHPVCYMKVRLIKSSQLKPDEFLCVAGTTPPCMMCLPEYKFLGQPADTTVYLKGYGNTENYVQWEFRNANTPAIFGIAQQSPPVFIYRFDTAQVVVNY